MRVNEEHYLSRIIHVGHLKSEYKHKALKTRFKEHFGICWLLLLFSVKQNKTIFTQ